MSGPLLSVHGLACGYGARPVLHGVDLDLAAGEVVGLIGPNGAGKSTLIKCLNGVQRFNAGQVLLAGKALATHGRRELARTVAYVPQHSGPAMSLRVADMVALGRLPHAGLNDAATDRERVLDAIEQLQLNALALRFFGELSGGERQRVLIARALAQDARLMLLDEPTSDLDLRHQLGALSTLRAVADRGIGVLVALHDLSLAGRFCDRLVMLHAGRVFAQGRWQQVLTPENLAAVYGVAVRIGTDGGLPTITALSELAAHANA